jgi:recombination protein RecA
MSPPYQLAQFEIVYGVGIDKLKEIMELASDFELIKKWGKTITMGETKYTIEEFSALLTDNEEFYNQLKSQIIDKINEIEKEVVIEETKIEIEFLTDENITADATSEI